MLMTRRLIMADLWSFLRPPELGGVRQADRDECHDVGLSVADALVAGLDGAMAQAVYRKEGYQVVGAFGFKEGVIWSLWCDLKDREHWEIARETPKWVAEMVTLNEGPLRNHVSCANGLALAWLRLSHCFDFAEGPHKVGSKDYLLFQTKPLDQLREMISDV